MNQVKADNVKNKLPNWPKITKNNELLEKINDTKIPFSRIPEKVYSWNPPFSQAKTKAIDTEISKLLKKGVTKPLFMSKWRIYPLFCDSKEWWGYRMILNLKKLKILDTILGIFILKYMP